MADFSSQQQEIILQKCGTTQCCKAHQSHNFICDRSRVKSHLYKDEDYSPNMSESLKIGHKQPSVTNQTNNSMACEVITHNILLQVSKVMDT